MLKTIYEYMNSNYSPISMRGGESVDYSPDSPEFKQWFGDSKIKTKKRFPIALYHGTPDGRWMDDDNAEFSTLTKRMGGADARECYYFTNDKKTATTYSKDKVAFDNQNAIPRVREYYLKVLNPLCVDCGNKRFNEATYTLPDDCKVSDLMKKYVKDDRTVRGSTSISMIAKENGYDGVIFYNVRDHYNANDRVKTGSIVVSVFNSNQIKCGVHNTGTYDETGRIYY